MKFANSLEVATVEGAVIGGIKRMKRWRKGRLHEFQSLVEGLERIERRRRKKKKKKSDRRELELSGVVTEPIKRKVASQEQESNRTGSRSTLGCPKVRLPASTASQAMGDKRCCMPKQDQERWLRRE